MRFIYFLAIFIGLLIGKSNILLASNTENADLKQTVDTLRISVGANKKVEIICPTEEGIELVKSTDINALVKSTYKKINSTGSNAKTIEIEFDDNGESKLIITAKSNKEFEELIDLDFNKMIELTGLYKQNEKSDEKIVVNRITTEHFKLNKENEDLQEDIKIPPYVECAPTYQIDTIVEREINTIRYKGYNLNNVGTQHDRYCRDIYEGFVIDFGINNYLEDGKLASEDSYKVKYWGSWYFSMKYNFTHHFGVTNKSPLGYSLWAGFDWYNFKFENNDVRIQNQNPRFYLYEGKGDTRKSKLTVPYFTIGLLPEIFLGTTRLAFGAYGSVRMGGHAKYKTKGTDEKNKQKDHSIHNLTKFRYGGRVEFGDRNGNWAVFTQYDASKIFDDQFSPELNPITIGMTWKIKTVNNNNTVVYKNK